MKTQQAFRTLRRIKSGRGRNLIRGILALKGVSQLGLDLVNSCREQLSAADLCVATELLQGRGGAYPFQNLTPSYQDLDHFHGLAAIDSGKETAFVIGRLNGWSAACVELGSDIEGIADLHEVAPSRGIEMLENFVAKWGVSNYLNNKLVTYMDRVQEYTEDVVSRCQVLMKTVGLEKNLTPYFSSMELTSNRYQYFNACQTWIDLFTKANVEDFRQILPLHNIIPVPISEADIGPFLRKCHAMSFVDEFVGIKVVSALNDYPRIQKILVANLNVQVKASYEGVQRKVAGWEALKDADYPDEQDLIVYRKAVAFLENEELVRFRQKLDSVVAHRLFPAVGNLSFFKPLSDDTWQEQKKALTRACLGFRGPSKLSNWQFGGSFLRTLHFLSYLSSFPNQIDFKDHEIRQIFNNTQALPLLITEGELRKLYQLSSSEGRILVSTLALALFKDRKHDDDIDFKYRSSLQSAIMRLFKGEIVIFVKWLGFSTPSVAGFIVKTLDLETIEKMYFTVKTFAQAVKIRQDLLKYWGNITGDIAFFIAADKLESHNKLYRLRKYIDDSRVYIDAVALKRWFSENPNAYLIEYRRIVANAMKQISRPAFFVADGVVLISAVMPVLDSVDFVLKQAMVGTFAEFCTNRHFGIDSFLGRRIRHNTLIGVMLGGVDTLIEKRLYASLRRDAEYMERYSKWLASYREVIEYIRVELLQFRGADRKKKGLFTSTLDGQAEGLRRDLTFLKRALLQNLDDEFADAVVTFCWAHFAPQLRNAEKFLSVDLRSTETRRLDDLLGAPVNDTERRFKGELSAAVRERFSQLGSWFRVPQNSVLSATVREIGEVISVECETRFGSNRLDWGGDGVEVTVTGSAVHRTYDCLFVLIYNALKHGDRTRGIRIEVQAGAEINALRPMSFKVVSYFRSTDDRTHQLSAIQEILSNTDNVDEAMVKEGYTGLRKVVYLTSKTEGKSTLVCQSTDESLTMSYDSVMEVSGSALIGASG